MKLRVSGERCAIESEQDVAVGEASSLRYSSGLLEGLAVVIELEGLVCVTSGVEELFTQCDGASDVVGHADPCVDDEQGVQTQSGLALYRGPILVPTLAFWGAPADLMGG